MNNFEDQLKQYVAKKVSAYESDKLLPLMMPTFGPDEILEAFDSMVSLQVTMGKKVKKIEMEFARYLNIEYATMVNSGSSANLLALSVL